MLDELDFRKEADNIDEFRTFLRDADITEATAPRVYRHLSTPKVLTMVSRRD
jgi:aarF domain-containing kinase